MDVRKFFSFDGPFSSFMNTLGNIIWTGLLWLLTSLPLVTIGCASMGAYRAATEGIRKQKNYITREFFAGFTAEWKRALPLQIFNLLFFAWIFFDCIYLYGYGTEYALVISYVLYGIVIIAFGINCYYYPCLLIFEENFFEIFKVSFYMTFRYLPTTIALVGLLALALVGIYLMPWSLMIVPGLWWYAAGFLIGKILERETDDGEIESTEDER